MSVEYWIWLQQVLGYGSDAVSRVIENYQTAKNFHAAPDKEKIAKCKLSRTQANKLHGISRRTIAQIISKCAAEEINIITPENPLYPQRLLAISNPPAVLYVKGKLMNIENKVAITIVGPRKPTDYGKAAAYTIAKTLASCNILIVSGGALGIDSAAHLGALDSPSDTVAVLGCGHCSDYLKANENLRERIANNGCLISEYPPLVGATKRSFPQRNRIMSGLSMGTVVIEASAKSGALITASHSVEQGRDVFVIPGSPSLKEYEGSNKLLRDGAKPLLNINDILEEYIDVYGDKLKMPVNLDTQIVKEIETKAVSFIETDKPQSTKNVMKSELDFTVLSEQAKELYLKLNGEFTIESIVQELKVNPSDAVALVSELEIFGFITADFGGVYNKFQ